MHFGVLCEGSNASRYKFHGFFQISQKPKFLQNYWSLIDTNNMKRIPLTRYWKFFSWWRIIKQDISRGVLPCNRKKTTMNVLLKKNSVEKERCPTIILKYLKQMTQHVLFQVSRFLETSTTFLACIALHSFCFPISINPFLIFLIEKNQ